jgi:hypothetical protein
MVYETEIGDEMHEDYFEQGIKLKRDLRLLARTIHNPTLSEALDYINKLEVLLITAEGNLLALESRGIEKSISEIIHDFKNHKPKPIQPQEVRNIRYPKIEKSDLPQDLHHLGEKVLTVFIILVRESHEWNGEPSVTSSSAGSSLRGALPHLKRANLLTTFVQQDGSERGNGTYVRFTDFGKRMAEKIDEIIKLIDSENSTE